MTRALVIANPSAHGGDGARVMAAALRRPQDGIDWVESRSAAHLQELVLAAQEDGALDVVAVAGGDGTVALAANALGGRAGGARLPLGIIPVGSGNDLAQQLGIPRRARDALALLRTGRPRAVDLLEDAGGARVACVASVGFDAIALPIVHGGLPRSKALNVYAAVQGILHYAPRPLRVTWEGGGHEGPLAFAAAANTRSYGGGFRIAPGARLDDGKLDVCLVKATGPARLMRIFAGVMAGAHAAFPEVLLAQSPWVRIEGMAGPDCELPVALDGDLTARRTPLAVACRPGALRVIAPAEVKVETEATMKEEAERAA